MLTKNYIQLIDVMKRYDDGYIAVQDINISIDKGEFVTLLGPSGCGKTTILKMIAGFDNPTAGRILVNDIDIKELPINQRPTATVFQDYALFPNMNVRQNIEYGLKVMRKSFKHIPDSVKSEAEFVYRSAVNKAAFEISKVKHEQINILRQLARLNLRYQAYKEVNNIRNMRYVQFQMKTEYFLKKLRQYIDPTAQLKMSQINKKREFRYRINRKIWKTQGLIKYDIQGLNKWEKLYLELRK
jgi:spermidine/putrescine transport system ATP-binding protein